jgi:hypothetical protein
MWLAIKVQKHRFLHPNVLYIFLRRRMILLMKGVGEGKAYSKGWRISDTQEPHWRCLTPLNFLDCTMIWERKLRKTPLQIKIIYNNNNIHASTRVIREISARLCREEVMRSRQCTKYADRFMWIGWEKSKVAIKISPKQVLVIQKSKRWLAG